ncbi:MAG: hypothetical protein NT077_00890 [Candidatus Taylorbacteria bacterium]|nr:hypothetical protein [Candidatus Taylorbacteria bacterium]
MRSIGEFFSGIQNKQTQKLLIYKVVQDAVEKHTGIKLEPSSVSFKAMTVVIRGVGHAAKSQIYIKKTPILSEIASKSLPRKVTDIHFDA